MVQSVFSDPKKWTKFLLAKRNTFDSLGIDLTDLILLGRGVNGCAYRLNNGKVMKLTTSSSEPKVALAIMEGLLPRDLFPTVRRVIRFNKSKGVHAIVRDSADNYEPSSAEYWDDIFFKELVESVSEDEDPEAFDDFFNQILDPKSVKWIWGSDERKEFEEFSRNLQKAYEAGYRVDDLDCGKTGNIAKDTSSGRVVIRDFGAVMYPKTSLEPEVVG